MPKEEQPIPIESQEEAFLNELASLIGRYRHEWDLTLSSIIGLLAVMKADMVEEMFERIEDGNL